jgi:hypothetical protein
MSDVKKELVGAGVWGVIMLGLAFGGKLAQHQGYIDHDTVTRLTTGAIGLWMVWYGNRIPKTFTRNPHARQLQRVTAWSQVLSGLIWAGLWAFAPIPVALKLGIGAILVSFAVTVGACLTTQARMKAS